MQFSSRVFPLHRIYLSMALLTVSVWGQVSVQTDALEILPARVELTPGEETQFGLRIRCSGLVLPTLQKSCTAGVLEDSGHYVAPMEPGIYQIRVWAQDRVGMSGVATILVLPKRLPVIERFVYLAPSQEVAWKVQGAQAVRLDPGPSGQPSEGQAQVPPGAGWMTLWATNDVGSVTKVLPIPQAPDEPRTVTALPGATSQQVSTKIIKPPVSVPNRVIFQAPNLPVAKNKSSVSLALVSSPVPVSSKLPWTLQVMVLADAKGLQKLREGGYLDQPGVFLFETTLTGGRRAACICYGRFASRQNALLATRNMAQKSRLTGETPCPRTIPSGIQLSAAGAYYAQHASRMTLVSSRTEFPVEKSFTIHPSWSFNPLTRQPASMLRTQAKATILDLTELALQIRAGIPH